MLKFKACKLPFHSVISRVFKEYCIFCRSTPCPVQCVLWDKSSWWQVWPESCSVFTASQSYLWCGKKLLVSLRNRTAERRGRQNACVLQTWQGYYLRVLSWSSLTLMFSGLLQNVLFNGLCSLAKFLFWKKIKNLVTLYTEGLQSSFLSRPVAYARYYEQVRLSERLKAQVKNKEGCQVS